MRFGPEMDSFSVKGTFVPVGAIGQDGGKTHFRPVSGV